MLTSERLKILQDAHYKIDLAFEAVCEAYELLFAQLSFDQIEAEGLHPTHYYLNRAYCLLQTTQKCMHNSYNLGLNDDRC